MYGGCILKNGKTLDEYGIVEGCTLHIIHVRKKRKCDHVVISRDLLKLQHTCIIFKEVS